MKKILALLLFLIIAFPALAQPPSATTLVKPYLQAKGLHTFMQPWNKEAIVADSTAIVDDTTIYSDAIWIAPFGGIGVIDMFVTAPDTDSVAVQYLYQLGNYTGADGYWTTFETSDTLFLESTLTTFYVEFDTVGAYSYIRFGFIPQCDADTAFICDDNINLYGWLTAKMDVNFYQTTFDPGKDAKQTFDDGFYYDKTGVDHK